MRPNVLLVTVDSLRADHVSYVADGPVETPAFDELAAAGTVFEDAYAQGPFTTFSMPSLFTSRYPSGLEYVAFSEGVVGVYPNHEPTVAELFSGAGYDTAGFHSNPLLSEVFGFDSGFDVFDADMPLSSELFSGRLNLVATKLRRLLRKHPYLPAAAITDRAAGWVSERRPDDPFFCWTHYMDVHGPYQRKSGWAYRQKLRSERLWRRAVHDPESMTEAATRELLTAYQEEVVYTDRHVGRLVDAMESSTERPLLVVLTADHGEGFGEHGYYSHPHEVDECLTRVPLIVRDPTRTLDGGTDTRPVELVDVVPTLLEAVGETPPGTMEGRNLAASREQPIAISEGELEPDTRAAFVTDRWRFVEDRIEGERRLVDRTESRTIPREENPERFDAFVDRAADHHSRPAASDTGRTEGDIEGADVRSRLRKLGYLE